jgi:fructokinase
MMMHESYTVVGLGEILWDLLPGGKQLGGAPANFAYHAQVLGADSCVASSVGDDPVGKEILDQLQTLGLDTRFIMQDPGHPTGTVSVTLDENGVPNFTIHEQVAWDFIPLTDNLLKLARECCAVCYGTLAQRSPASRSTIRQFLKETDENCLRVFDINLRQNFYDRDTVLDMLYLSVCLKLNDEELPVVARFCDLKGTESELLSALIKKYNLDLIALTKGKASSRLFTEADDSQLSAPAVTITDTVGAGDAFTAALVVGMLNGLPIREIHAHATKLAAFVCTRPGATPRIGIELKEHLQNKFKKGA